MVGRERQEPDPGGQPAVLEVFGGGGHAGRVGPVGLVAGEATPRPVDPRAIGVGRSVLPFVVDLNEGKPEGLHFFGGEIRQFDDVLLIAGPGAALGIQHAADLAIPGAVAVDLWVEPDVVLLLDGIGEELLADAGVGKVADEQRFEGGGLAGGQAQVAVVELRLEHDLVGLVDAGKHHPVAALVGQPAGDHALAGGRVGGR